MNARPDKAELLKSISEHAEVWSKARSVWEKAWKFAKEHWTISAGIGYLYFSVIGYIYDFVYLKARFGIDPLKYIMVEDLALSAGKHWKLTAISLLLIPVTWFLLFFLWQLFLRITWLVCFLTPGKPYVPESPKWKSLALPELPKRKLHPTDQSPQQKVLDNLSYVARFLFFLLRTLYTMLGNVLGFVVHVAIELPVLLILLLLSVVNEVILVLYAGIGAILSPVLRYVKGGLVAAAALITVLIPVVVASEGAAFTTITGENSPFCPRSPVGCEERGPVASRSFRSRRQYSPSNSIMPY